jgi:DNA-binding NtrC family response regulator
MLYNYSWPGNVRELRNTIESAIVMCKSNLISVDDLPPGIIHASGDENYIKLNANITLDEAEKEIIGFTLNQHQGNKSKVAEVLGIGRKTLYRKLKEFNLE